MTLSRRSAVGLVIMNAFGAAAVRGQIQQSPRPTINNNTGLPDIRGDRQAEPDSSLGERMKITAERARSEDRRKRMLSDSAKLLALSTELKDFLEKTTRDELSLDVIRKAAEIEKLAHDVQQRMKN